MNAHFRSVLFWGRRRQNKMLRISAKHPPWISITAYYLPNANRFQIEIRFHLAFDTESADSRLDSLISDSKSLSRMHISPSWKMLKVSTENQHLQGLWKFNRAKLAYSCRTPLVAPHSTVGSVSQAGMFGIQSLDAWVCQCVFSRILCLVLFFVASSRHFLAKRFRSFLRSFQYEDFYRFAKNF